MQRCSGGHQKSPSSCANDGTMHIGNESYIRAGWSNWIIIGIQKMKKATRNGCRRRRYLQCIIIKLRWYYDTAILWWWPAAAIIVVHNLYLFNQPKMMSLTGTGNKRVVYSFESFIVQRTCSVTAARLYWLLLLRCVFDGHSSTKRASTEK